MSTGRNIAVRNSAYVMAEKGMKMVTYLVAGSLLARIVGPQIFGIYSSYLAVSVVFTVISAMGLNALLVKEFIQSEQTDRVMINAFLLRVQGAAISGVVLVFVMILLLGSTYTEGFIALALVLVTSFQIADCLFEARLDLKKNFIYKSIGYAGGLTIKVFVAIYYPNVGALLTAHLAEMCLVFAGAVYLTRKNNVNPKIRDIDFGYQWDLFKRGLPLLLSSIAVILYMKIDVAMVLYLSGAADAGIYAAATRLCEALFILSTPIIVSSFPVILSFYQSDEMLYRRYMRRVFLIMLTLGVTVAACALALADFTVNILYGPDFFASADVIKIYALSLPIVFVGDLFSRWLVISNNLYMSLQRHVVGLVVNIVLNFMLIPIMGPSGAALASVCGYCAAILGFSISNKSARQFYGFLRAE